MPRPEAFEAFFFRCEASDGLPALINALRTLRMSDVLRSSIHIGNDYKVLNGLQQYPWSATDEQTPLTIEQMALFRDMVCYQEEVRDPSRVAEVLNRVILKAKRLSAPAQLNIVCFRYRATDADRINSEIVADIQESGIAAPSTTTLDGKLAIRAAIVNHRTDTRDLDALLAAVLEFGARRSAEDHAA